jgi:predicted AAA+ superfamily ATPase
MFDYLIYYVSERSSGRYRTKRTRPISFSDIADIENELSKEHEVVRPVVVGFFPLASDSEQSEDSNSLFLVRDVTTGESVEFHIRQEAFDYYRNLIALYGDLHEVEMVARLYRHTPPEVL